MYVGMTCRLTPGPQWAKCPMVTIGQLMEIWGLGTSFTWRRLIGATWQSLIRPLKPTKSLIRYNSVYHPSAIYNILDWRILDSLQLDERNGRCLQRTGTHAVKMLPMTWDCRTWGQFIMYSVIIDMHSPFITLLSDRIIITGAEESGYISDLFSPSCSEAIELGLGNPMIANHESIHNYGFMNQRMVWNIPYPNRKWNSQ